MALPTAKEWSEIVDALGPSDPKHRVIGIVHVLKRYRNMCSKIQDIVQRDQLGLGGEKIDDLLIAEYERLKAR